MLLVDDDEVDSGAFARLLAGIVDFDARLERAADGTVALEMLERARFDIAFIDERLAGPTGTGLIRAAGGRMSATPMVLITGHHDRSVEDDALEAGAFDCIEKEMLGPAMLRRVIRYVRAQHRTLADLSRAEQKSRELAFLAEGANEAKSRFLAQMSHELRTPLNAILGFSEIIHERSLGEGKEDRYRQYAGHIHKSGWVLLELINDILDLSKAEAGKFAIVSQPVSLPRLLRETLSALQPLAGKRAVEMRIDCPAAIPMAYADPRRVRQMVTNLLANALKFTHAGGHVVVSAREQGPYVEIRVTDTGIGMTPDALARVGEAFFQADDPFVRNTDGSGLGLALVKSLAEGHGGHMRIDSEPGVGTTVGFTLPVYSGIQT